ncbi:MAG TPA: FHA domain-containing protein [Anaerolineae bacterium]|nr:FHA domain-containing protein [Anaerolineae bacterium]
MSENMWTLTIRSPSKAPEEYVLKVGRNTIGRKPDNDIVLPDVSASRLHAVIHYDDETDAIMIYDMGSTNGTYINRERLSRPQRLESGDIIRVGGTVLYINNRNTNEYSLGYMGTRELTRDLLLESLDQNSVLLYEISRQLNTVVDIETALKKVSSLLKQAMGADKCVVILADEFSNIRNLGFPVSIAKATIKKKTATVIPGLGTGEKREISDSTILLKIRSVLCAPVLAGDDVIALIYLYKTEPDSRPFDQRDLELAVAISHQAALTIQRTKLIEKIKNEQRVRQLFERFLAPKEVEIVLNDYIRTGSLPGLQERDAAVLIVDIENSTGLAERIDPKTFGEILDHYYQDVTDAVFEWGGVVKYQGDGVIAVFGFVKDQGNRPEERSVRAALSILDRLEITQSNFNEGFSVGMGINAGKVVIGYIGSSQRVELTVLGDVVNTAFRLQSLARPNKIYIGPAVTAAVGESADLRSLGELKVHGKTSPIHVHQVLGMRKEWEDENDTADLDKQ